MTMASSTPETVAVISYTFVAATNAHRDRAVIPYARVVF